MRLGSECPHVHGDLDPTYCPRPIGNVKAVRHKDMETDLWGSPSVLGTQIGISKISSKGALLTTLTWAYGSPSPCIPLTEPWKEFPPLGTHPPPLLCPSIACAFKFTLVSCSPSPWPLQCISWALDLWLLPLCANRTLPSRCPQLLRPLKTPLDIPVN